ncbi:hypothetical protein IE53DRAFT_386536 [Violaceomyces palustris]|uniref:Uncharacterized protein n=1 Tax=Violaceomyces palustris TaxID=1673888 RepID=A0ACD0NZ60_9BASI|nr:hypothetical protein IE53DRAFT_386536 [Violaceomyces palustris]
MDRPSSEDGRMEDLSYALQLITDACQIEAAYLAQSLGGGEGEQSLSNWEPMCLYGNALGKSVEQNTGLDPEVHSHAVKEPLVFQHVELGDDLGKREAVLPWDYTGSEGQKFRAACLVPCRHGDGREECQLHWVLVALSTDPRRVFFSYELDFIKQFAALMVPVLMTTDVSQVRSPRKVEAIQRPSRKLTVVDRNNSRSTGSSPRMDCTGLPPRIVIPDEQDGERRLGITGTKKGRGLIGKGRGLRLSSDDVDSEINGFSDSDSEVSSDSQELPSFLLSNVDRLRESLGTRFGHDARMGSRKVEEDAAPASPSFGGGLQTSIFSNLCEPIPPPRDAAGNLIPDGSLTIQAGQGRSSSDSDHVTPEWGPPFITEGRIKEAGRKVASLFSGPWQSSHVHQHPSHATVVGQSRAWPVSSRLRYEDRRSPCISPWEKAASNTHPVSSLRRPATGIDSANDHRRLRLQSDRPGKMQGQLESPRCELEKQVRKIPSADDASLSSLAPNRDLDGERGQLKNHPSTGSFIVMGWESHRDARVEERRPNADVWAISTSRKEGPLASPTGTTYQGIEPGETKAVQDGSRRSSMARMVPGRSVLSMTFDQEEEGAYWVRRGSFSEGEVDGKELSQVDSTEGKALSFPDHLPGNVNLETSSNVVEGGGTKIYMTESQVASTEGFEMVM